MIKTGIVALMDKKNNLLDLYPVYAVNWEKKDNIIILKIPKFTNPFLIKYLLPLLKISTINIKLDEFGSFVWEHINGQTTVHEIGKALLEKFGDSIEPVYDRLGLFVNTLARQKFVQLYEQAMVANDNG